MTKHQIQLPMSEHHHNSQSEAFFYLVDNSGEREKISFHDYARIYQTPGLYEQIFYERLRCNSPKVIAEILHKAVSDTQENFSELRVLDFGAGNGIMGDVLKSYGTARLVAADIAPTAKMAAYRDRPGVYDEYYVEDFTNLTPEKTANLKEWSFDCLTTVAALGFGDIPVKAFQQAINLIKDGGWLAFNIKESFMKLSDTSGFSNFIRQLILSDYVDIHCIQRYRHRLSMEGVPLYYFAIVATKKKDLPDSLLVNT